MVEALLAEQWPNPVARLWRCPDGSAWEGVRQELGLTSLVLLSYLYGLIDSENFKEFF